MTSRESRGGRGNLFKTTKAIPALDVVHGASRRVSHTNHGHFASSERSIPPACATFLAACLFDAGLPDGPRPGVQGRGKDGKVSPGARWTWQDRAAAGRLMIENKSGHNSSGGLLLP